jgi:SepF-like predicted cell division protein (DUF552 family)
MFLDSIFKKGEEYRESSDEFIELEPLGEEQKKANIRIETMNDYRDVEGIQRHVREGNIVFLRIRKMRERDMGELKRVVERLRRTIIAMNGDIIGVDEDFLILTPPTVKIYRGEAEVKVE